MLPALPSPGKASLELVKGISQQAGFCLAEAFASYAWERDPGNELCHLPRRVRELFWELNQLSSPLKCFELGGVVSGTALTMRAITPILTYLAQSMVEALPRKSGIFKGNLVSLQKAGDLVHPEAEMLERRLPVFSWSLMFNTVGN